MFNCIDFVYIILKYIFMILILFFSECWKWTRSNFQDSRILWISKIYWQNCIDFVYIILKYIFMILILFFWFLSGCWKWTRNNFPIPVSGFQNFVITKLYWLVFILINKVLLRNCKNFLSNLISKNFSLYNLIKLKYYKNISAFGSD